MSDATPCNFCTLQSIERRNPDKKVEVRVDHEEMTGWWRVFIDDEPQGIWFMEVGRRCAC